MRQKWIKIINRTNENSKNKLWEPGRNSRICSEHFIDGAPTTLNPIPSKLMGYDCKRKIELFTETSKRRKLGKYQTESENCSKLCAKRINKTNLPENEESITSNEQTGNFENDPDIFSPSQLLDRDYNNNNNNCQKSDYYEYEKDIIYFDMIKALFFNTLLWKIHQIKVIYAFFYFLTYSFSAPKQTERKNISQLSLLLLSENRKLSKKIQYLQNKLKKKEKHCKCKKPMDEKILESDVDVINFTGIPTFTLFNKIYQGLKPLVRRKWRGSSLTYDIKRKYKKSPRKIGPQQKLTSKEEFLMTIMKIRLGLLNTDLAKRFGVSVTLTSRIFATWVKALASYLKPLLSVPSFDKIFSSSPPRFKEYPHLHSILDATEVFLETPKNLVAQRMTWSSYKHHNTAKILIAVAPNSSILFASKAYTGNISDKKLTLDCEYLDNVEPFCQIMVDKGFNISEECAVRNINVLIPPGKRGQAQLPSKDVSKTQKIAKLRILVEQVIRRFKTFRILATEMPINMLRHIDDIVTICAVLTNFRKPIYRL